MIGDSGTDAGWEAPATLAARARREREAFEPPPDPPAPDRALGYLTDGVGDVLARYVNARTGSFERFDAEELDALDRALNDWLELYAACYGADITAEFAVREAAELLVDTHDLRDVAQLLTRVPDPGEDRRRTQSS